MTLRLEEMEEMEEELNKECEMFFSKLRNTRLISIGDMSSLDVNIDNYNSVKVIKEDGNIEIINIASEYLRSEFPLITKLKNYFNVKLLFNMIKDTILCDIKKLTSDKITWHNLPENIYIIIKPIHIISESHSFFYYRVLLFE